MSINAGTGHESQVIERGTQQSVSQVAPNGSGGYHYTQRNLGMNTDWTPLQDISPCSNALPVNDSNERLHAEHSSYSGRRSTGSNAMSKKPRTRLDFTQKIEITKLLKKKTEHSDVARRFGCGMRTISRIASESGSLEAMKESPTFNGKAKAIYHGPLPEVDERLLKMIRDARRLRVPVTGDVISSFGRTIKKQLLASPEGISEVDKNKLEEFMASPKWKGNLVKRNGLVSKTLHGEAGGVDHDAAREGMDDIREAALNFDLDHIFNVDETGLFYKVLPRRTYLSEFGGRRTARGSKDMDQKDRLSMSVCTNATGSAKVSMSIIIGKAQNPRCFKAHGAPIKYFSQKKAWSDTRVFRSWWDELFLPFVRSFTKKRVLLLMDGCSSHVSLKDPQGQVHVMVFPPNCTSVYQPCDQGIIVSTKRHYRRRLLDIRADQFYDAVDLRDDARRRKLKQGTRGLKNGHQPHVLDACELLREAWDAVTPDAIARCWAVANTLPPIYQEELDTRRKKRKNHDDHEEGMGHSMKSPEETTDRQSVEGVINKLSKVMQEATEEKRAGFPDLRDVLDDLGVQNGDNATTAAVDAAVDWLDLEGPQGISDAVERDRQDIAIEHIHETAGDGISDSEDDGDHKENERDCGSPEELQRSLDCIDEFATLTDNPLVSHYVRKIREEVARTFHGGKEAENGETVS